MNTSGILPPLKKGVRLLVTEDERIQKIFSNDENRFKDLISWAIEKNICWEVGSGEEGGYGFCLIVTGFSDDESEFNSQIDELIHIVMKKRFRWISQTAAVDDFKEGSNNVGKVRAAA